MKIWQCKIGESVSVPKGADAPMREAVARAYKELTGKEPTFIFSGWGAELTEPERAVVEDRLPVQPAASARTDKMVWCACGDGYPADSYGAGFIDAAGHCENCEAAEHAASAEPDSENEHAAFEAWRKREYPWTSPITDGMGIVWDAWMERARRAAPVAQEPVATLHDDGHYTFKRKPAPYGSDHSGWRMDVFAAPVAAQPSVPEGWCIVPAAPTKGMLDAAEKVSWEDADTRGNCINQWNVMLAAAPIPPAVEQIICPKCGVDRGNVPCPGDLMSCPIRGEAQAAVEQPNSVPSGMEQIGWQLIQKNGLSVGGFARSNEELDAMKSSVVFDPRLDTFRPVYALKGTSPAVEQPYVDPCPQCTPGSYCATATCGRYAQIRSVIDAARKEQP